MIIKGAVKEMLENYTIEDVPEVVKSEMITTINTEGTAFNSFLIQSLELLTDTIEELEKGKSIIASSFIDVVLGLEFTAKNYVLIYDHEKEVFKINPSELESIIINCKSIINAVARIRELQTAKLKELSPEEMLIALIT